tara:strand:- start:201 stop:1082 length:882 start_codon:yes stop_codon:yes gene_type:complete
MIHITDVFDGLSKIDDKSIQTCITSPPYWGLRDYGMPDQLGLTKSPLEYVDQLVEVFREVRRTLKDDGTLWLNLGDSYNGSGATGGKGKSHTNAGAKGRPDNRAGFGGLKQKDLVGFPWRVALALQADGWYLRSDIIWSKPNPMPESVKDRPTKAHEYVFLLTKSKKYKYDNEAIMEETKGASGGGFSKKYAEAQLNHGAMKLDRPADTGKKNKRSVWTITPKPFKGAHFAVMPEALVEPCLLAGSGEGDLVLDPFAGSGTVGVVAKRHGRQFVGIELNPEYAALAAQRIEQS